MLSNSIVSTALPQFRGGPAVLKPAIALRSIRAAVADAAYKG